MALGLESGFAASAWDGTAHGHLLHAAILNLTLSIAEYNRKGKSLQAFSEADFSKEAKYPPTDFAEHAWPLFVPMDQATGVALPEVADLSAPAGQMRAFFRLNHLLFRLGDAALDLPWRGQAQGDKLPLCAVIGLDDPNVPISAAVDAAGAGSVTWMPSRCWRSPCGHCRPRNAPKSKPGCHSFPPSAAVLPFPCPPRRKPGQRRFQR